MVFVVSDLGLKNLTMTHLVDKKENKTIQKLDTELQNCLDNTQNNMLNCTLEYYNKIDNQLNITYKKIKSKLSKTEQEKLKSKQLAWLKKRDLYFKAEKSLRRPTSDR